MKRFFEFLGLTTLVCFSFFYTEKTVNVVKDLDEVMIRLKEMAPNYEIKAIDAKIDNNTIIPGLYGKTVNINTSYQEMRKIGSFSENYLVFNDIKPKLLLKNNLDKYIISGNSVKKQVSLIFLVDERTNINNVMAILNKNNIKGNFFIDGYWFENNNEKVIEMIDDGHNVGNLSYDLDYQNSSFVWMDTIIEKIGKQKTGFCYKTDNIEDLKLCSLQRNYTISPTTIVKSYPLITIKKELQAGSLIAMKVDNILEQELDLIIKYINSKDLKITTLTEHLSEK